MRKLLALTLTALLAAFAVIGAAASAPTPAADGATLSTDKTDYTPGETVIFTGSGFNPYEQVDIVLREDPARHPDTTLISAADERGAIINRDYKSTEENVGTSYTATATGRESGRTAVVRFTDGGNFSYSPNPLSPINVQSQPAAQVISRALTISAPNSGNNSFTADVTVTRPGGMPAAVTTVLTSADFLPSTNRLSYPSPNSGLTRSVTVTVTIPANAAAGSYTVNVKATQAPALSPPNQVGSGQGSDLTITITNDQTDPDTTASATAGGSDPYNFGSWTNKNVKVTLAATDTGTGVNQTFYSIDGGAYSLYPNGGINFNDEGVFVLMFYSTDFAGNAEDPDSAVIKIDKTKPVISAQRDTDANANGWNNTAVLSSYTASDALSGLPAGADTGSFTFASEGANQSHTFTVTDIAGNSANATVSGVNIDTTAPTISASLARPADHNGWYNADVVASATASDDGSGIDEANSSYAPYTFSDEGTSLSHTFTVIDLAGNSASDSVTGVNLDKTKPTLTFGPQSPAANAAGWNNTNVSFAYTTGDNLSGVDTASPASPLVLSSEGSAVSGSVTVTDVAGNSDTFTSPSVKIDKTAPSVTCGSPDGLWHAANVGINCSAADGLSGVGGSDTVTLTTSVNDGFEDANASTNSHTFTDVAGNTAAAGPVAGNKVDRKAPVINITVPAGNTYLLNQAVASAYTVTDGGSGVASSTPASGTALNTSTVGSKTFAVTATDDVGNQSSASAGYTVGYGFVALYDQTKSVKRGATIPIKIRLVDFNGANVSSPSVVVSAIKLVREAGLASDAMISDQNNANGDGNFRYDASLGGYIFNLSTKNMGLIDGTWRLDFAPAGDTTAHSVYFGVVR